MRNPLWTGCFAASLYVRHNPGSSESQIKPRRTVRSEWWEVTTGLLRQFLAEDGSVAGERNPGVQVDQASAHQLRDFAVEVLHAVGFAAFDRVEQRPSVVLTFFHAFARPGVRLEDFEYGETAAAIRARDKALRDDKAEGFCETLADGFLFFRWVGTNNAVDGFGGIDRIERRKHDQSHLGRLQHHLDGFTIAHFSDKDHLGRLAQGGAQG